jgi:hypothetical protein
VIVPACYAFSILHMCQPPSHLLDAKQPIRTTIV